MSNDIILKKDIEKFLDAENTKEISELYKRYIKLDDKSKSAFIDRFIKVSKSKNNIYNYASKNIYFISLILQNIPQDEYIYRLLKLIEHQYDLCNQEEQYNIRNDFRDNIIIKNYENLKEINIKKNRPTKERELIAKLFLNITFEDRNKKYINQDIKKKIIYFIEKSLLIDRNSMNLNEKILNIKENDENEIIENISEQVKIDKNIENEDISYKLNQIKYILNNLLIYIDFIEKENKIKDDNINIYYTKYDEEKKINESLNNLIQNKEEEIYKLKVSIQNKEKEYQDILSDINLLKIEKDSLSDEVQSKCEEIRELKEKLIKLANINSKQSNNEFNGYKNRLSSKLKLYYSEFKHGIDIIQSDSDKAQFLKDQLNDIFKILMDSDIKLK